ncbi:MAG: hypothetical protein J6K41_12945 [Paraprevotella sp.]|nr:hypothetical protein [Paraprevotella sp.]
MKRLSLIAFFGWLSVFAVLMNSSCDKGPGLSKDMSDIKALGDSLPMKALHKMDSLREIKSDCSEYEQRRYDLLYLRLQDKAEMIPASDSIAKSLYFYFEKRGTPADRMEASYYLASVYRDLHDSPQAIYYFLKSMEVADKYEGMDSVLLANACSQLAYLYNRQYNYQASLCVTLKELDIVEKINRLDARRVMDVATAYCRTCDTINAVKYQNLVLDVLKKEKNEAKFADVVAELVARYADIGMMDKADTCMRILSKIPVHQRPHNYNMAMALYFHGASQPDSAIHYYKMAYENGSVMGQCDGASALAELYYERKDFAKAAYYGLRFIEADREYCELLQHEQATNIRNEYQYNRDREGEAAAYKAASEARGRWLWTLAATSVFIIAAILFLLLQRLRFVNLERKRLEEIIVKDRELENNRETISQKNHLLSQQEAQIKEAVNQQRELEQMIREKDAEIAVMDKELEEKKARLTKKNSELHVVEEQLREKEELLLQKNEQNSLLLKYALSVNIKVHAKRIMEKFNRALSGKYELKEEDWRKFITAMDKLHPDFYKSLTQKLNKPTEDMIRIGYLLKAGMTNPQIEVLTGYPHPTVWRKVRTLKKVLGEDLSHL